MSTDEYYMHRCLQLARNGEIGAPPNPMVGAVIVCDGRIIGEGYHARCGQGHAEVNAFASVKETHLLSQSTLYVSLEPCSHYGKTPPCAKLIIEKGVKKVVVGCVDPFAKVHGRGIAMLRDAGVEVKVGVLEKECLALNRRFITFNTEHRPFVTLKWAQTADGVMGRIHSAEAGQLHISSPETFRRSHHLRATRKAILVGYRTALQDDPSLTTRFWDGPDPTRVVIDPKGELPLGLHIFDGTVLTIALTQKPDKFANINASVKAVRMEDAKLSAREVLNALYADGLQSLLVEGGANTLGMFLAEGLWDEAFVERSDKPAASLLGAGDIAVYAPVINRVPDDVIVYSRSKIYCFYNK